MVTSPGLALGCFAPWLPHAVEVLLQDLASDIYGLLSNKQATAVFVTVSRLFLWSQGWASTRLAGCRMVSQPEDGGNSCEFEMLGNKDKEQKVAGVTLSMRAVH